MGGVGSNCSNNVGTPFSFNCGYLLTDARDSKTYGTVKIGSQCWMSENLNHEPSSGNSWCNSNLDSNCDIYGRLYDWSAATNDISSTTNPIGVQGVCPPGWHVPSDLEWQELEMFLGMSSNDANNTGWRGTNETDALKAVSFGGNNPSGFTALPGGAVYPDGSYTGVGDRSGNWWSTGGAGISAVRRYLERNNSAIVRNAVPKGNGYPIRCTSN